MIDEKVCTSKIDRRKELQQVISSFANRGLSSSPSVVTDLYFDPEGDNRLLTKLSDTTSCTVLVGRSGTGKSIAVARSLVHLRKIKKLGCRIDLADLCGIAENEARDCETHMDECKSFSLKCNLLRRIMSGVRTQLEEKPSALEKLLPFLNKTAKLFDQIVKEHIDDPTYMFGGGSAERRRRIEQVESESHHAKLKADASLEGLSASTLSEARRNQKKLMEEETKDKRKPRIPFDEFFDDLREALRKFDISELHVFLDDFSRLDSEDAKLVTDHVIQPLLQLSEPNKTLVKLCIAMHPRHAESNRIGGVDEVATLDIESELQHSVVESADFQKLEQAPLFFIELIKKRFDYYARCDIEQFFDVEKQPMNHYYNLLFKASNGAPRIVGHLLSFLYESHWKNDKGIVVDERAILKAARRHFSECISLLDKTKKPSKCLEVLPDSLDEDQVKILNSIANAKCSHFYFPESLEDYISQLVHTFHISKIGTAEAENEKDRKTGKERYSIFTLNLGYCVLEKIKLIDAEDIDAQHPASLEESPFTDLTELVENHALEQVIVALLFDKTEGLNMERLKDETKQSVRATVREIEDTVRELISAGRLTKERKSQRSKYLYRIIKEEQEQHQNLQTSIR